MEEQDLKKKLALYLWSLNRQIPRVNESETIEFVDLVDIATTCKCLLLDLKEHGVEVV